MRRGHMHGEGEAAHWALVAVISVVVTPTEEELSPGQNCCIPQLLMTTYGRLLPLQCSTLVGGQEAGRCITKCGIACMQHKRVCLSWKVWHGVCKLQCMQRRSSHLWPTPTPLTRS